MAPKPKKRQQYTFGIQETADLGFSKEFRKRFSAFEVDENAHLIKYTAKGANKDDVTRRLRLVGVKPDDIIDEARSGTKVLDAA